MSGIRLIVNADDFGMSRGVTDAVIIAHRYGFLTSASLMANMPAAEYALSRALTFPSLAVGVHLNICQGRPLLRAREVSTLIGSDGNFYPPPEMAQRLWTWRVAHAEIENEFRAQIRWARQHGIALSHADSHHHMHIYLAAAGAFARALEAEGISTMRACNCAEWPTSNVVGAPYGGGTLRRLFVQAYRRLLQCIIFRRFESPDSRVALSPDHCDGAMNIRERWKAALESLPPGTFELACHPGIFERGFSETDAIHAQRERELICLTDRDLLDVIERRKIRLISYRDLLSPGRVERSTSEAAA
ncbi:MAG: carbohydrate deacetylase [Candidatus Acidiferrales bacterium]